MKKLIWTAIVMAASVALPGAVTFAAAQDITIGVSISTTGPAAALGIPEKNAIEFVPTEIGGAKIKMIVLDDAGDPTTATTNARRFVTESNADIIIGSSVTPPSIAISTVANEVGVPQFSLAPMPITPGRGKWTAVMPQPVADHGQGALRAHEEERREKRRLYRLLGFLRRSLAQRSEDADRCDGAASPSSPKSAMRVPIPQSRGRC